jgi:chorismate mutase/prephenate dehydratase
MARTTAAASTARPLVFDALVEAASRRGGPEASTFSLRSEGAAANDAGGEWTPEEVEMDKAAPGPLQVVRSRIDAIDAEMHRLLIDRSGVIAELIRIKGISKPGAAFRPDREADMMRRIVQRHEGKLPLTTVEHIWREIITAFTAMQAPFGVVAGPSGDALAMRDLVRFYFGFSVPAETAETSEAAVARVAASQQHIAIVDVDATDRWWGGLADPDAPKIFAKLPFIESPDRPAGLSAYVIGPPLKDTIVPDMRVLALTSTPQSVAAVESFGGRVAARREDNVIVELPIAACLDDVGGGTGAMLQDAVEVGGFCQPIRFVAERIA